MAQATTATAHEGIAPGRAIGSGSLRGARSFLARLLKGRGGAFGLGVALVLIFMALTAPLISPASPFRQDLLETLQKPSAAHLFGTDDLGRDVLSRVIYGSRVSLVVGLISIGVALLGGILVGLAAGYFGGSADDVLRRIMD